MHGPFSENFKWVTLEDRKDRPIGFTDQQARVFRVLCEAKGKPMHRDRLVARAKLPTDSKTVDAFKVRARYKDSVLHQDRLNAYHALVQSSEQGEYWMPCASAQR